MNSHNSHSNAAVEMARPKRRGRRGGRKHHHANRSSHAQPGNPVVEQRTKSGRPLLAYAMHKTDDLLGHVPQSLPDAQELLSRVKVAITDIQLQLGDRSRRDGMDKAEYDSWRGRALRMVALLFARQENLKQTVALLQREEKTDDGGLFRELGIMACAWVEEFGLAGDLAPAENETLQRVRKVLNLDTASANGVQ